MKKITLFLLLISVFSLLGVSGCSIDNTDSGTEPLAYTVQLRVLGVETTAGTIRVFFNDKELQTETAFTAEETRTGVLKAYYDPMTNGKPSDIRQLIPHINDENYTLSSDNIIELILYKEKLYVFDTRTFVESGVALTLTGDGKEEDYQINFNNEQLKPGSRKLFHINDLSGTLQLKNKITNEMVYNAQVQLPENSLLTMFQVDTDFVPMTVDEPDPESSNTIKIRFLYLGKPGDMLNEPVYTMQLATTDENFDLTHPILLSEEFEIKKGELTPFFSITKDDIQASGGFVFIKVVTVDGTELIKFEDFFMVSLILENERFINKFESYMLDAQGTPVIFHTIPW